MKHSPGLPTFSLFEIGITTDTKENILKYISEWLNVRRETMILFTVNPEILAYAQQHSNFKEVVRTAQINLPDGWGVVWAIRRMGGPIVHRIAGVDFLENLCQLAADQRFRVGFLGGRQNLALEAYERLKLRHPRLEGVVIDAPDFMIQQASLSVSGNSPWSSVAAYVDMVAAQIRKDQIRILFVALGVPKQEYLISALQKRLAQDSGQPATVLMAVGGSLDYLSGAVPRAPIWIRDRGGEWLYRLVTQPWRLGRQLRGGRFFWEVWRRT